METSVNKSVKIQYTIFPKFEWILSLAATIFSFFWAISWGVEVNNTVLASSRPVLMLHSLVALLVGLTFANHIYTWFFVWSDTILIEEEFIAQLPISTSNSINFHSKFDYTYVYFDSIRTSDEPYRKGGAYIELRQGNSILKVAPCFIKNREEIAKKLPDNLKYIWEISY